MHNIEKHDSWFKRENHLGNFLFLASMLFSAVGIIAATYARFSLLEIKVNTDSVRLDRMEMTQQTTSEALAKLTILIDERTRK